MVVVGSVIINNILEEEGASWRFERTRLDSLTFLVCHGNYQTQRLYMYIRRVVNESHSHSFSISQHKFSLPDHCITED